jgi:hypothetical protein
MTDWNITFEFSLIKFVLGLQLLRESVLVFCEVEMSCRQFNVSVSINLDINGVLQAEYGISQKASSAYYKSV